MQYTFTQFQTKYPDDAACLQAVMHCQFGGTRLYCSRCSFETEFHAMTKRRAYACQGCGLHIYPCAQTVFRKTRTPLTSWFFAMHLMISNIGGVRAADLERQIGCSSKTAGRMARRLRELLAASDHGSALWQSHVNIVRHLSAVGGSAIGPAPEQVSNAK
jgi:transposase